MQAASDLRKMLRSSNEESRYSTESNESEGPYNFQQFLRKTKYAPTDTIRKRKEERARNGC